MRANRASACMFAVAASLAGCTGTGEVDYAGEVRISSPELIEISPGIQVIADADEPLFYADSYYWLYRDGYWLRSDDYRRGFVRIELAYVPQRVRLIERPQMYVQYRRHLGRDQQARGMQQPTRTRPAPSTYQAPYQTQPQPAPPPPHQGVPSTPAPETWQPQQPVPATPPPTPPITSPNDTRATPMPPHNVPPIDVDRPYGDSQSPDRVPPGQDRPVPPPGQANRPSTIGGQNPPATAPDSRREDRGNRPEDRGNRPDDRGNRPEDRGNGRDKSDKNRKKTR